jgi:hypothetical protein
MIIAEVSPGKTFQQGVPFTTADLNAAARPTVQLSGTLSADEISDGAITPQKLSNGPYFYGAAVLTVAAPQKYYAVSPTPNYTSYAAGQLLIFTADAATEGATNIKVGALAIVDLLDQNGQELKAGDIRAGDTVMAICRVDLLGPWRVVGTLNRSATRYATSAGTANAQTVAFEAPIASLAQIEGIPLLFKVGAALTNTGAMTVAVDGTAATAVKLPNGSDVVAGDVVAGTIAAICYNGTNFNLLNPAGFAAYSTVGLIFQKISTVTLGGMDVSSGSQIPYDNTIPHVSQGEAFSNLDTSITPKSAASSLLVTVVINGIQTDTDGHFTAALFLDSESDARAASTLYIDAPSPSDSNAYGPLVLQYKMASGSIAAKSFKVRLGHSGATTDWGVGGRISGGANHLGGIIPSSLTIEEIG